MEDLIKKQSFREIDKYTGRQYEKVDYNTSI